MIYELKLWKKEFPGYSGLSKVKPDKVVRFTDYGSKGHAIRHADHLAINGGYGSMQLDALRFEGRLAKADFGHGKGRDPIISGTTRNNPVKKSLTSYYSSLSPSERRQEIDAALVTLKWANTGAQRKKAERHLKRLRNAKNPRSRRYRRNGKRASTKRIGVAWHKSHGRGQKALSELLRKRHGFKRSHLRKGMFGSTQQYKKNPHRRKK